jgi:TorA maturation chaperone TorD
MAMTALGAVFQLLSVAWQPPTERSVASVVDGDLGRALGANAAAVGVDRTALDGFADALDDLRGRAANDVLHELRREHTRLFLGNPPLLTNSEGPWRKYAEGKEGVALMVNSYSTEVADFMRFCGVTRAITYNDCVDYVENELDFAGFLANGPSYLAEHGLDANELLGRFCAEHLVLWLPGFCRQVADAAKLPYYRALADLTGAFVTGL